MGSPPGHSEAPALGVMQDRVRLLCVVCDKYVEAQVATAFSKAPLLMERAVAIRYRGASVELKRRV